jgi:hypothetical protein
MLIAAAQSTGAATSLEGVRGTAPRPPVTARRRLPRAVAKLLTFQSPLSSSQNATCV